MKTMKTGPRPTESVNGDSADLFVEYESIGEMFDAADAVGGGFHPTNVGMADGRARGGRNWMQGATFDNLRASLVRPRTEIIAAVQEMRDRLEEQLAPPLKRRRKRRDRQEEGEELDPQAVAEMRPDGWSRIVRVMRRKHVAELGVNMTVHAGLEQQHMIYRGAAICAVADMLTTEGHSVGVTAYMAALNPGPLTRRFAMSFRVKQPDAPLDIAAVSTATCDLGFLRLAMFSAMIRSMTSPCRPTLGYPASVPDFAKRHVDVMVEGDVFTEKSAVETVREIMVKFRENEG